MQVLINFKEVDMTNLDVESLLRKNDDEAAAGRAGRASKGNIDKTGCFYHVITKSFDGGPVFLQDIGEYRHTLLCSLCGQRGITILFSATLPNHTHDVLLAPGWECLMDAYRVLDRTISRMVRRRNPKKYRGGMRVLRRYPVYVAIKDIVTLFYEGKYVYDNPAHLRRDGKYVPHTSYWMFEKNYFPSPYDESLYVKLFGMTGSEIFGIYSTMTASQVLEFAKRRFSSWTPEMNNAVFSRKPGSPV